MGGQSSIPIPNVDMTGKVVIVTGASAGIGYETAKRLSYMGAKVIMACRDEAKAQKAVTKMKEESHEALGKDKDLQLEIMTLDLNSLQSVVNFANEFKQKGYQLHVLICNAGIAFMTKGVAGDGHEQHFQVNYLGHFLLILHLLPVLRETGVDCRIISVSSIAHERGKFDLDNIQAQRSYNRFIFYGNSKLFQIMMTYALQRRLKSSHIRVFALHPGLIVSDLNRCFTDSRFYSGVFNFAKNTGIAKDLAYGATTSVIVATSPSVIEKQNCYYVPLGKAAQPIAKARNEADQEALWKYSLDLLKDFVTDETLQGLEGSEP